MTKYLSILILFTFFACSKETGTFDIGGKYVDVQTNLSYIDTFTVKSYTVRLDSLRTSGLGESDAAAMVGYYNDPEIGDINASSYFRISLPLIKTVPKNAIFDSLRLILVYNKLSIGDTLKPFTIHVHRLNETIKPNEDKYLYNKSRFSYSLEDFGSLTFRPRPNTADTVRVPLNDEFGLELITLMLAKDERLTQPDNFVNYFKGLTIQADSSNQSEIGFKVSSAVPAMRMYFHYMDFENIVAYRDFPIYDYVNTQFNHFNIENALIPLPQKQTDKVPAAVTNVNTFVQGGTGIVTRLEIPYLKNIQEFFEHVQVLKAELVLEPVRDTYKDMLLPEKLSLYTTDNINRFGSPILNPNTGQVLTGKLTIDEIYQEETTYTFDITSFITSKMNEETDDIPALLVTITPNDIYRLTERLVLGSRNHNLNRVKLKIYYMNY